MNLEMKKVAILGSGVMGSTIAAHFANVGIPCLLMDLPAPEGDPNAVVRKGLENAKRAKPASFYSKKGAALVEIGNFQSDLGKLAQCDLILEAVVERIEIKKELWKKVDAVRRPGSLVATNTSGLGINEMIADCSPDFRQHFFGMHFFNPPRYLKLLEIIPARETNPGVIAAVCRFGETILGKGIVICRDTPNFIANRIGAYWVSTIMKTAETDGLSVQEVDLLTGTNIGHPKSATFRTADVVGLDVLTHVTLNLYDGLKDDDEKEVFKPSEIMKYLVEAGSLGAKSGRGFYHKRDDGEIEHLDLKTRNYVPKQTVRFKCIDAARSEENSAAKLKAIVFAGDKGSEFLWKVIASTFLYAAKRIGEICDSLTEIDNAMKWGWGHGRGPFEKMDVLGVASSVERMKKEGRSIPKIIEEFLAAGNQTFYKTEQGKDFYYDFRTRAYQPVLRNEKIVILANRKAMGKTILSNAGATLIDLDDGIACLEFHTKMNAIGPDVISMANKAMDEVEKNFEGMVIGNQHERAFSAGANLMLLLMAIGEEEWDDVDLLLRSFQKLNMRFRQSSKPVVAAVAGLALGGGCEVCIHSGQVVAAAETYMGLVEVGAGLIPAGGGTKEVLLRAMDGLPESTIKLPFLQKALETIAMGKVSTSAEEAKEMGFLRPSDRIVVNGDFLLQAAKQTALRLAKSEYRPALPRTDIQVMGRQGFAAVKVFVGSMLEGKFITEHDATIALKLGHILTGGKISGKELVSEQYLLDLEREAFLSLCGMRKTQERMKHILETGKPLRN